jgi:hypothetical protein
LPLCGLSPTATLSVVTSSHTETTNQLLPNLDFDSAFWQGFTWGGFDKLTKMASIISEEMVIPSLPAPAPNSSYTLQFYGPTFQCEAANSAEQQVFDQNSMEMWNESQTFTSLTFPMFNDETLEVPKGYDYPSDLSFLLLSIFVPFNTQLQNGQFWVQTPNKSFVCLQSNASFVVDIDYLNGFQTINQRSIGIMNVVDYDGMAIDPAPGSYSYIRDGLYDILVGNVSFPDKTDLDQENINLLNMGLITCDEIFWWIDNYPQLPYEFNSLGLPYRYSECRNRSISLAIQDLANNLTISLLGNPNMTVNVSIPVTITSPQNIYHYDSRNLIISYATGLAATLFAVVMGLMAIHSNGVCHSTSFSAVMTTTIGNRQISELSKGQSLGAKPLSKTVAEKKLRLGVIKVVDGEAEKDEWGDPINRIGFGLEGTVTKLMKDVKSF